ncbi:MAG: hypothetical protein ACYC8W_07330 [Candidatus Tyrphobacter sp.]
MRWAWDVHEERVTKLQVLAFIEEHCRGLTLRDVREWYNEAFDPEAPRDAGNRS